MKKIPDKENHNIALGTTLIIIVLVVVFGAVFAWMYSMDMLFLPGFIEQFLGIDEDDGEIVWDLGALSEIVKNGKGQAGETVTFDLTYENLREALLSKEAETGFYLTAEYEYFEGDKTSSRRISYYRDGERFRIQLYALTDAGASSSPSVETLKIADEKQLYVLDYPSGKARTINRSASISPENEAGIPSVEALLETVADFPEDIGNMGADAPIIALVESEGGNVYFVSYTHTDIGVTEEYYVSLEQRMIIAAITKKGEKTLYSYKTKSFSTDPEAYSQGALYTFSKSKQQ